MRCTRRGDCHHPLVSCCLPRRVALPTTVETILAGIDKGAVMPSPYNLDVHHKCEDCTVRANRDFCNMSQASVAVLGRVKFTSVYPAGSVLFVEGEQPRGVFILCSGRAKLTTSSSEGKTLIVKIAQE